MKPVGNEKRRVTDGYAFLARDEVEDVSPGFAFPKTLEAVFGNRDSETGLVAAAIERAEANETIARPLETIGYPVVVEDLNDGYRLLYEVETDKIR
jgi:hypothetical protein